MAKHKKNSPEDLRIRGDKIVDEADKLGLKESYFFVTTFKRYQKQMEIITILEKEMEGLDSLMVEKTYSSDKKNLYTHPAITEYNRTCTAANQTAQTLIKILDSLAGDSEEVDEFKEFMARR